MTSRKSVVYTRQGNPAWSGQERDGIAPVRSDDLFFGGAQPDYVDLSKVAIPQADEQQRLLANLIGVHEPRSQAAAEVLVFPARAEGGRRHDRRRSRQQRHGGALRHLQRRTARAGCSVADWECVRGTSYIYPSTPISPSVRRPRSSRRGSRSRVHVTTNCGRLHARRRSRPTTPAISPQFAANFPSLPAPADQPHPLHPLERLRHAAAGRARPRHPPGHELLLLAGELGERRPRPVHRIGHADALRQARRHDDRRLPGGDADDRRIRPELIRSRSTRCSIARSVPRATTARLSPTCTPTSTEQPGSRRPSSARRSSAACRSSRRKQMLEWLDGRNGSSFGGLSWATNTLTFTVAAGAGANGLRGLVPAGLSVGPITGITRNDLNLRHHRDDQRSGVCDIHRDCR